MVITQKDLLVPLAYTPVLASDSPSSPPQPRLPASAPPSRVPPPLLSLSPSPSCPSPSASKTIKTTANQLLLKLESISVVCTMSMAKINKAQMASLREFKVYGGLNPACTHELLHSGFYADDKPESFSLRHTTGGSGSSNVTYLPVQYIKIVPAAGKPSMPNTWIVELQGVCAPAFTQQVVASYNQFRENEVNRLCLKHFRRQKMQQAFDALLLSAPVASQWEHPLITELFNTLAIHGDFEKAEKLMEQSHVANYFSEYLAVYPYTPHWKRIMPKVGEASPGMRGGHQMCIDEKEGQIFLFGGWDGSKDLADFWVYHIKEQTWDLLSNDVEMEGGPGPRSCHKICFDEKLRRIYTLGRYVDSDLPPPPPPVVTPQSQHFSTLHPTMSQLIHAAILPNPHLLSSLPHPSSHTTTATHQSSQPPQTSQTTPSSHVATNARVVDLSPDFFYYDVDARKWVKLSSDTSRDGGPQLIFDHQMVVEAQPQLLYVFGGKAISTNQTDHYSGLYEYNIATNTWRLLIDEERGTLKSVPFASLLSTSTTNTHTNAHTNTSSMRSRIGHSMLYNPKERTLYIFAGQRSKDYLSDFFEYKIDDDQIVELVRDSHRVGGPEGGFTQRATFDGELGEIYVLSGLMRERLTNTDTVKNSFWVYHIAQRKWRKVYQNENKGQQYWLTMQHKEPRPRFAHQLVYDSTNREHYMFGGNPGESDYPYERLDDFWSLTLERPSSEFILSRLKFFLRKQQYFEICARGVNQEKVKMEALHFLREKVVKTVSSNDELTVNMFNSLPLALFDVLESEKTGNTYEQRYKLFEEILEYFPEAMRPPHGDLSEFID